MPRTAFFAYPEQPRFLGDAIQDSIAGVRTTHDLIITPWPELNIIGLKLDNLIRERIAGADFLIADVTYPNFNVYLRDRVRRRARKAVCSLCELLCRKSK
jgi:hypothetical protein